jgi:hypothetical protein
VAAIFVVQLPTGDRRVPAIAVGNDLADTGLKAIILAQTERETAASLLGASPFFAKTTASASPANLPPSMTVATYATKLAKLIKTSPQTLPSHSSFAAYEIRLRSEIEKVSERIQGLKSNSNIELLPGEQRAKYTRRNS